MEFLSKSGKKLVKRRKKKPELERKEKEETLLLCEQQRSVETRRSNTEESYTIVHENGLASRGRINIHFISKPDKRRFTMQNHFCVTKVKIFDEKYELLVLSNSPFWQAKKNTYLK